MYLMMAIAGLIAGAVVGGTHGGLLGATAGLVIGVLIARLSDLSRRVSHLDQRLMNLAASKSPPPPPRQAPARKTPTPKKRIAEDPFVTEQGRLKPGSAATAPWTPVPRSAQAESRFKTETKTTSNRHMPASSPFDEFIANVTQWITGGNVPVKVGVVVSFIGIAFLLKYAVQNELIYISLEARFIAAAIAGFALIATGLRLRKRMRSYALTLQGGGVAIVYLTIYSAMRLYGLLEPSTAISLSVAMSALTGTLAVTQDSRTLAVFGIVGGFAAPLLAPLFEANHISLFGYYLTLNAAILGIAWFRSWRELNVLGLLFTFAVGGLWGINKYDVQFFVSTEIFLILHFVLYQAVAILFAIRQPTNLKGVVDGTLLLALPVLAFAIQAQLVAHIEYGLAYSAIVLAAAYAATAIALRKSGHAHFRLLTEVFFALAIAFGTLAIPLALDARWTTASWALEGAALVWLAMRQNNLLARYSGCALLIAAGVSFAAFGWEDGQNLVILNGNVVGGVLVAVASIIAANLLRRDDGNDIHARYAQAMSLGLFAWGLLWWIGTGVAEISAQVAADYRLIANGLLLTGTALLLSELAARLDWRIPMLTTVWFLPGMVLMGFAILLGGDRLTDNGGWFLWLVAVTTQFLILYRLKNLEQKVLETLHVASVIATAALIIAEVYLRVFDLGGGSVWASSVLIILPCLFAAALVRLRHSRDWPLDEFRKEYVEQASGLLIGFQLVAMTLINLSSPGDPYPLNYVPLFNPLTISSAISLLVTLYWASNISTLRDDENDQLWPNAKKAVLVLFVVVSTMSLLRGAHHLADISWNADRLFDSTIVQAALSIYWSILGVIGMVWGARSGRRKIWIAGTVMMTIVVVKLFLVDLSGVGTLSRIVSFVGVGGLLLLVGYHAPVPPRENGQAKELAQ